MTIRVGTIGAALLLAGVLPLAAQERPAPSPPPHERIERLRLERLHESLGLTEEQTETLRRQMDRSHQAMRESFERQREAMEALEKSLAERPPDDEALRRAMAEVETARAAMEREREQHMDELSRTLTLEQRARFLLFNREFDSRLRELVEKHRHGREGVAAHEDAGAHRALPGRIPDQREATREQKIGFLEQRIRELQRQLEELRSEPES
jgi:Spy/CpxP family protein refolding chaperone